MIKYQTDLAMHAAANTILQIPAGELKQYLDEDRKRTFEEGIRMGLNLAELSRMGADEPLTVEEAAKELGCSARTIFRRRLNGELESIDDGKIVRFERSEIERYKRTHRSLTASINQ